MRGALVAVAAAAGGPGRRGGRAELVQVGDVRRPRRVAAPPGDAVAPVRRRARRPGAAGQERRGRAGAVRRPERATCVAGGERGLLGMAFAPDYATLAAALYVFLTGRSRRPASCRSASCGARRDPDRAVPGAGRLVLGVPHAQARQPQRRPARVRPRRHAVRRAPATAAAPTTPRTTPPTPARCSARSCASIRAGARAPPGNPFGNPSGPTACATRGASRSTARPATS